MCLTPLMVAVIAKNINAMEKLMKNGADPSLCPVTVNLSNVRETVEQSKYGNKVMFKKEFGIK